VLKKGIFIVFEGPDKSGKSTQAKILARELEKRGCSVLHTREPGGTPFAEDIRRILLDTSYDLAPLSELFLYEAARAQHTQETLLPALKSGKIVISERYVLASLAYQGYGRGLSLKLVRSLNAAASGGLKPHLTVLIDVPVDSFSERMKGVSPDRLEKEGSAFRRRVREGYRKLSKTERNIFVVDGRGQIEEIHKKIISRIEKLIRSCGHISYEII
jgi:dTMP kinase